MIRLPNTRKNTFIIAISPLICKKKRFLGKDREPILFFLAMATKNKIELVKNNTS